MSITTTSAYTAASGALSRVGDTDIPQYRFTIVPNGGQRVISTVELGFSVRVDTGGTDEAITVDNIGIYEVGGGISDTAPPTAPTSLARGRIRRQRLARLDGVDRQRRSDRIRRLP
ncbi:hypothetical protein FHR32_007331 [Streptosporangium album]|uniref:Uncharacterized protein n=1 Tax=Streptosporangium album TaxID=47479 RepID=A0A7W7WDA8_9ACTN|nr:hypothetical protein [Streptosporangium album]MBB4942931.1 hypothetical protein [Streptosporangium album]